MWKGVFYEMGKILDEELIYEILSVVEEIPKGCVAAYGLAGIRMQGWWEKYLAWLNFMGNIHATGW